MLTHNSLQYIKLQEAVVIVSSSSDVEPDNSLRYVNESREIRRQQDIAFQESLTIDKMKVGHLLMSYSIFFSNNYS